MRPDNFLTRCAIYSAPMYYQKQKTFEAMNSRQEWKDLRSCTTPGRMRHAKKRITALGHHITRENKFELEFRYKCETVRFNPFTGWASGKTIQDGRGLQNLLNQIAPNSAR